MPSGLKLDVVSKFFVTVATVWPKPKSPSRPDNNPPPGAVGLYRVNMLPTAFEPLATSSAPFEQTAKDQMFLTGVGVNATVRAVEIGVPALVPVTVSLAVS